jgi:hypothetical protein
MRTAFSLLLIALLPVILAACSISDCAYYGEADASYRCVISGPSPRGGYD